MYGRRRVVHICFFLILSLDNVKNMHIAPLFAVHAMKNEQCSGSGLLFLCYRESGIVRKSDKIW